jgi:hypothetical protein
MVKIGNYFNAVMEFIMRENAKNTAFFGKSSFPYHNHQSKTFKKNRRRELKLSAKRRRK